MNIKLKVRDMQRPPHTSSLAAAKTHKSEAKIFNEFESVKRDTATLTRGVMYEDGTRDDYCHDKGRVILADGLASVGGHWVINCPAKETYLDKARPIRVNADLSYQPRETNRSNDEFAWMDHPDGEVSKAFVEVKESRLGIGAGTYEYEKKKTVEVWKHTTPDGASKEYRLSRGVLTVTQ